MNNCVVQSAVALLLAVVAANGSAQPSTGTVRGVVTDSNGVVPGVAVTLVHGDTGAVRRTVSNQSGLYDLAAVAPGVYTLKVELAGFKAVEYTGLRVGVQQVVTRDIRLEAGGMHEMVAVTEPPPIDLANASTLSAIDARLFDTLRRRGHTGGSRLEAAATSGGHRWRGTAFYQARPRWGMANDFFAERAGVPIGEAHLHLGGGHAGGPLVPNRTFFWVAAEGYDSKTPRHGALRLPTEREKRGDFSESVDSAGRLVVVYDPLTGNPSTGQGRQPFAGNVIPPHRLNPVALRMIGFLPAADTQVSDGSINVNRTAAIEDRARMYSGKVDHRFSDALSLAGFYLHNQTDERDATYFEPGRDGTNRFADPRDAIVRRRVHLLTLDQTWVPRANTVLTVRYGMNTFDDDRTPSIDFDPAELGFPSSFVNALAFRKFPYVAVTDYGEGGTGRLMGAGDPADVRWHSWSAHAALSTLIGRHTWKIGADYRALGLDFQSFDEASGHFLFDRRLTSADPAQNGTGGAAPSGNGFASFLLGYPSGDPANLSRVSRALPLQVFTRDVGFYAQDDFRINPKLTLNYGLRLEHEDGLAEKSNLIAVGFDRTLDPGGALGSLVNPLSGQRIAGGLIFAGVNGANRHQGDPPALKRSPRVGLVYAMNPKTVMRAGYGMYWAPWNYPSPGAVNYGQVGASRQTFISQGPYYPSATLSDPFPGPLPAPAGNASGPQTGVGGEIRFVDQDKRAPYVHQYSADISRELGNGIVAGVEYAGTTGRDLSLGGASDAAVNINQVPPQFWPLGAGRLNEEVPNPFFGLPAGQGFAVSSPTVPRSQLLRPFPQFGDVLMLQSTLGRSQYHAGIVKVEKRVTNGWGGRIRYTYSRLRDNQFGERNGFSQTDGAAADAYNLRDEYAIGVLDVPHTLVMAPIVELPFGAGKRWATAGFGNAILRDWTLSSIVSFESGFPFAPGASSNDLSVLGVRTQRVNAGSGDPRSAGSRTERIAGTWFTPAAFSDPVGIVQGTLPRTLATVRTPHRHNWDFVATRALRLPGPARAEIRLEILNVTNTVKVLGPTHTVGSATFGQTRAQSGFMRLTQLMFRLRF